MIKSLNILNFQSHEKTNLEFSPGVNIIIGSSDSGKTAIIRAMRWVIWNRPSGNSICSNWGGKTSVNLETEGGYVSRSKDKTDTYLLDVGKGKDNTFKAFGTSVPEEISKFLNINEINLQSQLDAPFLLSETPGVVASHFNKVARFDKIDTSTANVKKWITDLNSDINRLGITIEEKTEALKEYNYLEKAEVDLEVLEEMDKRYVNLLQKQTKLETLIIDTKGLKSDIKFESKILVYEKPLSVILDNIDTLAEVDVEQVKLDRIVSEIKQINENLLQFNQVLILEEPLLNMLKLLKDKETSEEERKRLYRAITTVKSTKQQVIKATDDKAALDEKFESVFPSICPLCSKPK